MADSPEDVLAAEVEQVLRALRACRDRAWARNKTDLAFIFGELVPQGIVAAESLASRLAAETARADAADPLRDAGLLLAADIPCNNGCGCEGYDYCAQDEWTAALARFDAAKETR